uniref:Uncharacterized protein n=1 Tax=Timema monikensis TaxID=170555 RepID=A0A7R9EE80_9NEOP|nr:unnamed protein product [Timema monikensis]
MNDTEYSPDKLIYIEDLVQLISTVFQRRTLQEPSDILQKNVASDVLFDCCAHMHIGGEWGGWRDCQVERALLLLQFRLCRDT